MRPVFFFVFFMNPLLSFAVEHENSGWFFRVDTRPPEEIFLNGFISLGGDDNVRDHSRGVSCFHSHRNSAFISVSTDPQYAASYARRMVASTGRSVYVYVIRSTTNFYRMSSTLRYNNYQTGIQNAEAQSEWVAYRSIPSDIIQGAREYVNETTPAVIPNENYIDIRPQINELPYSQYRRESVPGYLPLSTDSNSSVGACFSAGLFCIKEKIDGGYCESREVMGFYSAVIVDNDHFLASEEPGFLSSLK